jgi:hypothetical protein
LYVIFILHNGCSKLVDTTINLDATMYSKFRCISSFSAFQVIENLIGGTENRLGMIFAQMQRSCHFLLGPVPQIFVTRILVFTTYCLCLSYYLTLFIMPWMNPGLHHFKECTDLQPARRFVSKISRCVLEISGCVR